MNKEALLHLVNKNAYAKEKVVDYYDKLNELFPAEKILFEKLSPKLRSSKTLDIGIGGGRTTKYLLPLCADYTGVDYLPQFIERVKGKFENGNFGVSDARDLSEFDNETFDFILFSYNGIDVVSHEERIKILSEIYRVLKKGRMFMFSSHNRDYKNFGKMYWLEDFQFKAAMLKNVLSYLFFLPRHLLMKRYEVFNDQYAIVNDSDHRYSLLVYYINIYEQIKQLEEVGFHNIEAYNDAGESVKNDTDSFWIYYLSEK